MFSLTAAGWFGGREYHRVGVVTFPYPIGFWPRYLHSAPYYSRLGWCYQRRRTWHGIVYSAIIPPISAQPHTVAQEMNKLKFAAGMALWQGLTSDQQQVWRAYPRRKHMSGYNLFLHSYMRNKI